MKEICYLASGYPSLEKSFQIAELYLEAGCDAIEWCIPPDDPYVDPPYIAEKMRHARSNCNDYEKYFRNLADFCKKHSEAEIILLLYEETIQMLTPERVAAFCNENGIKTILSGNLRKKEFKEKLIHNGIQIAASMNYTMYPDELESVLSSNGFIYLQALPTPQDIVEGRGPETLQNAIKKLRSLGVTRQIYCGVGIRKPEDIIFIHQSGGQGFFLGSSIMKYYEEPEQLKETIRSFKMAAVQAETV